VLLLQLLELIEDLLGGDHLLVDPSDFALGGLHSHEAAATFEHLQLVPVLHRRGAVRHGRHPVA
jgi:hypothetical protein